MSEFEELFQSIQNSVTVDVVRDSAIVLVNECDAEHPLKAGEYYFDDEKNILYVGGYVPEKFYIWKFIQHDTSTRYIPAPRIKVSHLLEIPTITKTVTYYARLASRLKVSNTVNLMNILTVNAEANKTMLHKYSFSNNVVLPSITHRTEVQNVK